MEVDRWREMGRLVRRARTTRGLGQEDVADRLQAYMDKPFLQAKVSKNEAGREWSLDLVRAYTKVLNLPTSDVMAIVMGAEDGPAATVGSTFEQLVHSDPTLTDEAKQHLVNQYALLREASAYARRMLDKGKESGTA